MVLQHYKPAKSRLVMDVGRSTIGRKSHNKQIIFLSFLSFNVKIQQTSDSSTGFLSLLVAFHNVRLAADIRVEESGDTYSVTRKSWGVWTLNPSSYPVVVHLFDFRGNEIVYSI